MQARYQDGTRVRLRGEVDPTFYAGLAKVGNEGWITSHRTDRNGLPECYIQWDRLHWADNRQPNGWTYEEHFDLVKEPVTDTPTPEQLAHLWTTMKAIFVGDTPGPPVEPQADDKVAQYQESAKEAAAAVEDAEAFITITVSRDPDEAAPDGRMGVSMFGFSISPETEAVLGMQLAQAAAKFHQDAALLNIKHFTTKSD